MKTGKENLFVFCCSDSVHRNYLSVWGGGVCACVCVCMCVSHLKVEGSLWGLLGLQSVPFQLYDPPKEQVWVSGLTPDNAPHYLWCHLHSDKYPPLHSNEDNRPPNNHLICINKSNSFM